MRLPTSPRRRRRLAWVSAATVGIVAVTAVFVLIPSHGGATKQLDSSLVHKTPGDLGASADETKFAASFIHDLAARRNLSARYDDLTPAYQRANPRSAWEAGTVPIPAQQLTTGSEHFFVKFVDGHTTGYVIEIPRERQPPYEYYSITITDASGRPLVDSVTDNGVIEPLPAGCGNGRCLEDKAPNWVLAGIFYGVIALTTLALAAVAFFAIRRARRAGRRFAYPTKPMPTLPGQSEPDSEPTDDDDDDHEATRHGSE